MPILTKHEFSMDDACETVCMPACVCIHRFSKHRHHIQLHQIPSKSIGQDYMCQQTYLPRFIWTGKQHFDPAGRSVKLIQPDYVHGYVTPDNSLNFESVKKCWLV